MEIRNLTLRFGLQTIFDNVSLSLPEKEKIGIIGVNGAGKTTFFKLLLKELEPDQGSIYFPNKRRISYLPQVITDEIPSLDITVFEYLLKARPIEKLQNKIAERYTEMLNQNANEQNKTLQKIEKLQTELDYFEPLKAESELLKLIDGMSIDAPLLDQTLKQLSGGQKSKIAFARLLYSKPDLILLDEPTNHLDEKTKTYVTNYLKQYDGSIFIISHDIPFLNAITTKTLYVDKQHHSMELFDGNYDKFQKIKVAREERLQKEYEIQEKERKKLEEIIARYIHGNEKKAKIAKDRQKKLARLLENEIIIEKQNKKTHLDLTAERESTRFPIRLEEVSFKYDKKAKRNLLYKISFEIPRKERFLIVGENGVGKSTLLKLIIGELTPDQGKVILGPKTDIAYYAQEHELLDPEKNLIENLEEFNLSFQEAQGVLGKFLFGKDELYKKVKTLSPGERSRIALAKLTLKKANVLLLDEPTNHLDPDTQKIIADHLKTFDGTIILVSHNADFVDQLGINRNLILPEGRLAYYDKKVVSYFEEKNKKD